MHAPLPTFPTASAGAPSLLPVSRFRQCLPRREQLFGHAACSRKALRGGIPTPFLEPVPYFCQLLARITYVSRKSSRNGVLIKGSKGRDSLHPTALISQKVLIKSFLERQISLKSVNLFADMLTHSLDDALTRSVALLLSCSLSHSFSSLGSIAALFWHLCAVYVSAFCE